VTALLMKFGYMGIYATLIASHDIRDKDLEVLVANTHTITTTTSYSTDQCWPICWISVSNHLRRTK